MTLTRWKRNPAVVARRIGERTILVPTGRGIVDHRSLFTLNETGSLIWAELARPRTMEQIHRSIVSEFEVAPDEAREDIRRFVEQMVQRGCVIQEGDEP